jgi:ATP-binding cassette subfamily C protein
MRKVNNDVRQTPVMLETEQKQGARSELAEALRRCRAAFLAVALVSGLINLLMLTAPLFMLQVYDRVLPSRSVPTLIGLAILTICLFAFQGILDVIRGRVLQRVGGSLHEDLCTRAYNAVARLPLTMRGGGNGSQPMRDLDQIRGFFGTSGPSAFFDLPWMPFYVVVCFLFHPLIGVAASFAALILVALTISAEVVTQKPAKAANRYAAQRGALLEATRRNAEVVHALGMGPAMTARFAAINDNFIHAQGSTSDRAGMLGAISRIARLIVQSFVLGLGAYLVINQEATAGVIIASSILVSRSLAPVEQAIANWKGFIGAREAYKRLNKLLTLLPALQQILPLPKPSRSLVVEAVSANPPGESRFVLQDVSFELKSGMALGIIGPSASGKSSLARLIVGVWQPPRGKVRLDGAALDQWSPEALGRHIGYLPQEVELFDGSIAENISRFDQNADPKAIIDAARSAGVHELIVSLSEGYETCMGDSGSRLSAGQRQRIVLARALYGDPFLVVLDEPNSNLDSEGEAALSKAILGIRSRGGIAVVIAHRANALAAVDHVLVLSQGRLQVFGPKDEVLRTASPRPGALTVVAKTMAEAS